LTKGPRLDDEELVDINGIEGGHDGSTFADPEACFVMMMIALPFSSTRAFATAHAIRIDCREP